MKRVRASSVVVACMLGGAPVLEACDATFRFDEPLPDAGGGSADASTSDDARARTPCASDATCGTLRCETSIGRCVACLADADCSAPFARCDGSLHVCVACLENGDCKTRQRCETTTRRCLDTCFDDDDPCPIANFSCDRDLRLCVECRSSANCAGSASGPVCDVAIGRCVECTSNAKCPTEKPVCDRRTGKCVGCVSSAACEIGFTCDPATLACAERP